MFLEAWTPFQAYPVAVTLVTVTLKLPALVCPGDLVLTVPALDVVRGPHVVLEDTVVGVVDG